MKKYVEGFPDPGPLPERPGEQPRGHDYAGDAWRDWNRKTNEFNAHLVKLRKHRVATAVDALNEKWRNNDYSLDPADTISQTMGVMFLEGSMDDTPKDMLSMIFGR